MKQYISAILVCTLFLSLAACSGVNEPAGSEELSVMSSAALSESADSPASVQPSHASLPSSASSVSDEEATFDSQKDYSGTLISRFLDVSRLSDKTKQNIADVLCADAFSVSIKADIRLEETISTSLTITASADGINRYFSFDAAGNRNVYLVNSSGAYVLSPSDKTARRLSDGEKTAAGVLSVADNPIVRQLLQSVLPDFGQAPLSFVQNGTELYREQPLDFEEYVLGRTSVKLYYDGNTPKYILLQKDSAKAELEFLSLRPDADPIFFSVPEDYTVG